MAPQTRAEPRGCGADGRVAPGGPADTVPDTRTQIDKMTLSLDGSEFREGHDSFVADRHQAFVEVKAVLEKRRNDMNKARNASNAYIGRGSPGRHAKVGDLVMVNQTEDEVKDSFTPLQLDVFHAMWEVCEVADCSPKPDGIPSKGKRRAASREEALTRQPIGTQVKREFADDIGEPTAFTGMVYDPNEPLGRVRSPDRGWEELDSQEMKRERQKLAARRPFHQMENPSAEIWRVCTEDHGQIFSEHKVLNEECTARSTRTFLNSLTCFGVVQPGGVHTSTREGEAQDGPFSGTVRACRFLEEKGSFKIVGLLSSMGTVR